MIPLSRPCAGISMVGAQRREAPDQARGIGEFQTPASTAPSAIATAA
jgi:hypothetical protein